MSKRKGASPIKAWMDECDRHAFQWHKPLRREFKAMESVVRAARWWVEADMKFEPGTPADRLYAAMARLERLRRGAK